MRLRLRNLEHLFLLLRVSPTPVLRQARFSSLLSSSFVSPFQLCLAFGAAREILLKFLAEISSCFSEDRDRGPEKFGPSSGLASSEFSSSLDEKRKGIRKTPGQKSSGLAVRVLEGSSTPSPLAGNSIENLQDFSGFDPNALQRDLLVVPSCSR